MKINEDYVIAPNADSTESFRIQIVDPDSEFLNWVFQVNSMKFAEDETEDSARLAIDYDIIYPAEESEFLKIYSGPDDQRILDTLGPCIENILELAVAKAALVIEDDTDDEEETPEEVTAPEQK